MNQLALPIKVNPDEIARIKSLGDSIHLCAALAGYELDKTLQLKIGADKAQFSRWMNGEEGIKWPKVAAMMDACGNDAPVFWMLHQRGYDLHSVRKVESEIERQNRLLRDENAALRRVLQGATV